MFRYRIDSFTVNETIDTEDYSMIIITGSNSVGKSTLLREMSLRLQNPRYSDEDIVKIILKDMTIDIQGDEEGFIQWMKNNYRVNIFNNQQYKEYLVVLGNSFPVEWLPKAWEYLTDKNSQNGANITGFLSHYLDTEQRFKIGGPVKQYVDDLTNTRHNYIHVLQSNDILLKEISKELNRVFDVDLIINWGAGEHVWFHVGKEPERTVERDRVSSEYLNELGKLPRLTDAGDGLRSYASTLIAFLCGSYPIFLLDEPEVFLHPPQIRNLAAFLAKNAEDKERQIIVSTHSSDFIQGALNGSSKVLICRLSRSGDESSMQILNSEIVQDMTQNPLLQSVSAVEGLFHRGVVLCESDADVGFYSAILRKISSDNDLYIPYDFYFTHAAGKGNIPKLAKIYRDLRVPVTVIADFDLLSNKRELLSVIEALTENSDSINRIETMYSNVIHKLNDIPPIESLDEVIEAIKQKLDDIGRSGSIGSTNKEYISDLMNNATKWSKAKKYGRSILDDESAQVCDNLLQECKEVGLFLVPEGELEGWWREGSAKKTK